MNQMKTLVLLSTLTALFLWAGHALGGQGGLILALVVAALMNLGAYWFSDRIVLRMYNAQEVAPGDQPGLHAMVRELALRANLPMPRVFLIPEDAPNAFATGRSPERGVVAVTAGLLRLLNKQEIAGVIAHELGHIRNRDTLIMSLAATLAGALSMLANAAMWGAFMGGRSDDDEGASHPMAGLLGVLIAPIAASLVQMSISRTREFLADEAAASFTGQPLVLAQALRKIEAWSHEIPMQSGSPATAHMFILNPFTGGGLMRLFSTHPPTAERVARLEALAQSPMVSVA